MATRMPLLRRSPLWAATPAALAVQCRSLAMHTTGCVTAPSRGRRTRVLPATTTHITPTSSVWGSSQGPGKPFGNASSSSGLDGGGPSIALPPLRCPGGPRMKAEGLKQLHKVPHAGYLAKYDQRFILNLKLTHQLVSYLSRTTLKTPDKVLVELGPAAGSMTRSLLTRPCVGILAIEVDERYNPHLEQIRNYTRGKFQWVNADVLKVDELALLQAAFPRFVEQHQRRPPSAEGREAAEGSGGGYEGAPLRSAERERLLQRRLRRHGHTAGEMHSSGGEAAANDRTSPNPAFDITDHWWASGDAKVEVVANLPFDVITELLVRYAVDCSRHTGVFAFGRVPLHIFTQKEVAERITAAAGSMEFSRLSVLCQCYFHVRLKQTFSEWTYYPRTEVLGAMLTLEPRTVPLVRGLDGATLAHFTDLLLKPGTRGSTVYKALLRCVPPEVVQYILQESHMDGAVTVLDLSIAEVATMALMWKNFLEASQQQYQKP